MYFVDSLRQRITSYAYDVGTGALGEPEPFVDVPRDAGLPDGLTVADDGSVWVAMAGGGVVHRYDDHGVLRGSSSCRCGSRPAAPSAAPR